MQISSLVKLLEAIKNTHGDLTCRVHDGMDPSDMEPVTGLSVVKEETWIYPRKTPLNEEFVNIDS